MVPIPCFGHIYGFRDPRLGRQPNDVEALQRLYPMPLPEVMVKFLVELSDCVLYYSFETTGTRGRPKRYSQFLTTNIGPDPPSPYPFPTSLINRTLAWRSAGMSPEALPLMMQLGNSRWIFCRVLPDRAPICLPKGQSEFGESDREWNELAPSLEDFLQQLQFDLRPLHSALRSVDPLQIGEPMQQLLRHALGEHWAHEVRKSIGSKG